MTDISITLANGRSVTFNVGNGGAHPPCFMLSMRKCGSSITNNICKTIAKANRRQFVDVGHKFFIENVLAIDWCHDPSLRELIRPGAIYGGFRNMPESLLVDPAFIQAPKLLMIRDPRDALVSEYFSNAFSHPIPKGAEGADEVTKMLEAERAQALMEDIQEAVMRRAKHLNKGYVSYAPTLSLPNMLVLKYEDVILNKAELIRKMCAHFSMQASEQAIADILSWADVMPSEENPRAFVRQVTPGDHRRKLTPATIAFLNKVFAVPMRLFGYEP